MRELFKSSIETELLDAFEEGMDLREEADYSMICSEEGAQELIASAQRFLAKTKHILKIPT